MGAAVSAPIDLGPIRRAVAGGEDINPTTAGAMVREIEEWRAAAEAYFNARPGVDQSNASVRLLALLPPIYIGRG